MVRFLDMLFSTKLCFLIRPKYLLVLFFHVVRLQLMKLNTKSLKSSSYAILIFSEDTNVLLLFSYTQPYLISHELTSWRIPPIHLLKVIGKNDLIIYTRWNYGQIEAYILMHIHILNSKEVL